MKNKKPICLGLLLSFTLIAGCSKPVIVDADTNEQSAQVQTSESMTTQEDLTSEKTTSLIYSSDKEDIKNKETSETEVTVLTEETTESTQESTETQETETTEKIEESTQEEPQEIIREEPVKETPEPTPEISERPQEVHQSPAPTYTYENLDKTMYSSTSLNVRSGPSTNYPIIGSLSFNEGVQVTGKCNETGWYRVSYNGQEGFSSGSYLVDKKIEIVTPTPPQNTTPQNTTKPVEPPINPTSSTQDQTQTPPIQEQIPEPEPPVQEVVIPNGICEMDGNVDVSYLTYVNNRLSVIPTNLLNTFGANGWHIYVTDLDLASAVYKGQFASVLGSTSYKEKRILIEDRQKAVQDAPLHEFGHYFDGILGYYSSTTDFDSIYNEEQETFIKAFKVTHYWTKKEFFADIFKEYFDNGQKLAENCPQSYTMMDNLIASYR